MAGEQCTDAFFTECDDDKKHWTLLQLFRKLTAKVTGSDCPALRVAVTSISSAAGTQRTASRTSVSVSGSVAAGSQSVTFETDGTFVGDILGTPAEANRFYTFAAKDADTLGALAYTITAGNIIINKIV